MKIATFSMHDFEASFLNEANIKHQFEMTYFKTALTPQTAQLAHDCEAITCFVTDQLNAETLKILSQGKTRFIALRSAGFNHVDLKAAKEYGFTLQLKGISSNAF
ncbi:MAG: D-lactate dehydrogenase [Legionellaceae bacterium]